MGSAGLIRTRTSAHQIPSALATMGLRASSLTSGRSSASLETRSSTSASTAVSTGGVSAWPNSSGAARTARIIASASVSVSGVSRGYLVAVHLGGLPAGPEHHQRPEHGLLHHADHHLDASGHHRLDEHPRQAWPGSLPTSVRYPSAIPRGAQIEPGAPGVGPVPQPLSLRLEHDAAAELPGGGRDRFRSLAAAMVATSGTP